MKSLCFYLTYFFPPTCRSLRNIPCKYLLSSIELVFSFNSPRCYCLNLRIDHQIRLWESHKGSKIYYQDATAKYWNVNITIIHGRAIPIFSSNIALGSFYILENEVLCIRTGMAVLAAQICNTIPTESRTRLHRRHFGCSKNRSKDFSS